MKLLVKKKIGFVGCGTMGSALIAALTQESFISSTNIFVFDKDRKRAVSCVKKNGVAISETYEHLIKQCDVIVFAVKPQNIQAVCGTVSKELYHSKLCVSILAGTTLARLQQLLGAKVHIIRCMPNLAITVGAGVSVLCKNQRATLRDLFLAQKLFSCCGIVLTIPEKHFNTVTAISGSGPAYYFYLTERLTHEATKRGMKQKNAELLARKTAEGAALLMEQGGLLPEELRKRVTSPGGTTEAALKILTSSSFKKLLSSAITKAIQRAEKLSS